MSNLFSLSGKTILLTGAAGGLGTLYTKTLSQAGANLLLLDYVADDLASLSSDLNTNSIHWEACDLRDRDATDSAVEKLLTTSGTIDILINNAAITGNFFRQLNKSARLEEADPRVWDDTIEVNLSEAYLMIKRVLPLMLDQGHGNIINVASIYGHTSPDFSIYPSISEAPPLSYAVSKAGVLQLTRYVAHMYGPAGIRCNSLSPGGVQTPEHKKEFVNSYSKKTALKRMAEPANMLGPLIFLCSSASDYVTGVDLLVDGGWMAN